MHYRARRMPRRAAGVGNFSSRALCRRLAFGHDGSQASAVSGNPIRWRMATGRIAQSGRAKGESRRRGVSRGNCRSGTVLRKAHPGDARGRSFGIRRLPGRFWLVFRFARGCVHGRGRLLERAAFVQRSDGVRQGGKLHHQFPSGIGAVRFWLQRFAARLRGLSPPRLPGRTTIHLHTIRGPGARREWRSCRRHRDHSRSDASYLLLHRGQRDGQRECEHLRH